MHKRQHFSIVAEINALLAAGDSRLDPFDRDTLTQLANDPCIEQVWRNIRKACGEPANLIVSFVVWEILGARRCAVAANVCPDYLAHAKMAESLAMFLRGSDAPLPPLPMVANSALVPVLNEIASALREIDKRSLVHRSRKDVDGSRQYTVFMRLVSATMHDWYGHWFDAEVADLTNIFFPGAFATTDSVRATRRPTRNRGRAVKVVIAA